MEDIVKTNKELANAFRETLPFIGHLVAVKMLKPREADAIKDAKRPRPGNSLCQLIAQVHYLGRRHLVRLEDQICYAPPYLFGTGDLPAEAHKRYVGWQMKTEEAAKKTVEAALKFPKGLYDAIYMTPLERCAVAPDVVVFFGNASQMLVIVASYLANRGGALPAEFSGMMACGGLIIVPMLQGRPNIVLPGNPVRLLALPDRELGCGIPGNMLAELVANMQFMKANGGSQYPPTWQVIQWPVQPPTSEMLKPDGSPTWLKR